jgi:hypothetical protein
VKLATRLSLLSVVLLPACDTTRDVASTSFHVVTAPVRFVHRHIFGEEEETPPPSANAPVTSDVSTPGQPVPVATPTPPRRSVASSTSKTKTTATSKTRTSASSDASASTQFPTAKPVPGRPGLVLNPFGSGYIDVSGYAPGSKVKDPDSQKIFIVP